MTPTEIADDEAPELVPLSELSEPLSEGEGEGVAILGVVVVVGRTAVDGPLVGDVVVVVVGGT